MKLEKATVLVTYFRDSSLLCKQDKQHGEQQNTLKYHCSQDSCN